MQKSRDLRLLLVLCVTGVGDCRVRTPPPTVPSTPEAAAQAPSVWHSYDFPFRVNNITSNRDQLWLCGGNEALAVSFDNGEHWKVKHLQKSERGLLNVDFAGPNFGYATGTGGLFLTTSDGGEKWVEHTGIKSTILQASFADKKHGLVRTTASLSFTVDGGSHWSKIPEGQNAEDIRDFPYIFSLVALDSAHMAVMLKAGPAQYYAQAFLFTQDSGRTWNFLNIPNVTIYSFLRVKHRYWAVGTEVIHKDQPGGGYAVAVGLYSSDGSTWNHSTADHSGREMYTVCKAQGCFSSNGVIARISSRKTAHYEFAPNKELTTKWASIDSAFCFVREPLLNCSSLKKVRAPSAPPSPIALPTVVAP